MIQFKHNYIYFTIDCKTVFNCQELEIFKFRGFFIVETLVYFQFMEICQAQEAAFFY